MTDPVTSSAWTQLRQLRKERDEARGALGLITAGLNPAFVPAHLVALIEQQRDEAQAHVRNHHLEACETCAANESEVISLRALLTEVEWLEGYDSQGDEIIECPVCHAQQSSYGEYRKHAPDCRLAAALGGHDG